MNWRCMLGFLLCLALGSPVFAVGQCQGHFIDPVTDLCWQCFFPITIGSTTVNNGDLPDTPNPKKPICHCGDNPLKGWGLAVGYWAPTLLVDVTRHPYCLVNLGGIQLPSILHAGEGSVANYSAGNNQSFYYVHTYNFPVIVLLGAMLGGSCAAPSTFGVGFLTELDPTWHDEKLNAVLYPEMIPVNRHIIAAQVGDAADCIAATTHLPLDSVYWSAGCQGSLYPLEGKVQAHVDSVQATTLLSERALLLLHRLGLMQDSDQDHLCHEYTPYYLPKSHYRYQLLNPTVVHRGYPLGHSTASFASFVLKPTESEDFGYIIWQKRNCCAF